MAATQRRMHGTEGKQVDGRLMKITTNARIIRGLCALLIGVAVPFQNMSPAFSSSPNAAAPLLAYAARIASDGARTRVVFDFDGKPDFSIHYITSPERIVVDLPATGFGFSESGVPAGGVFTEVRFGNMGENSSRIVLTAGKPVRLVHADVQANENGKGFRLVLEAEKTTPETFQDLVRKQDWSAVAAVSVNETAAPPAAGKGEFVIAVDAGHGGIDTGATGGATGTQEKDITLAFAKDLMERLNREPGVRAVLTRDSDRFLALSERVAIARRNHANLLLSLHADTLKQKDIRGATVYTISDKASDRMAEDLATRENLSDQVAGVSMPDAPQEVADILIDLTRQETRAFSVALAGGIVSSFEGQIRLINNPHRYAGFRVLQAHDVPSILLELGFLSNADDEKLLLDAEWRKKVAGLLADAVTRYRKNTLANGG